MLELNTTTSVSLMRSAARARSPSGSSALPSVRRETSCWFHSSCSITPSPVTVSQVAPSGFA